MLEGPIFLCVRRPPHPAYFSDIKNIFPWTWCIFLSFVGLISWGSENWFLASTQCFTKLSTTSNFTGNLMYLLLVINNQTIWHRWSLINYSTILVTNYSTIHLDKTQSYLPLHYKKQSGLFSTMIQRQKLQMGRVCFFILMCFHILLK